MNDLKIEMIMKLFLMASFFLSTKEQVGYRLDIGRI